MNLVARDIYLQYVACKEHAVEVTRFLKISRNELISLVCPVFLVHNDLFGVKALKPKPCGSLSTESRRSWRQGFRNNQPLREICANPSTPGVKSTC